VQRRGGGPAKRWASAVGKKTNVVVLSGPKMAPAGRKGGDRRKAQGWHRRTPHENSKLRAGFDRRDVAKIHRNLSGKTPSPGVGTTVGGRGKRTPKRPDEADTGLNRPA